MKPSKIKTVKVMTGTDIPFCTPSHPYTVAVQVREVLDRIVRCADKEFELNCNIPAGIAIFEEYGRQKLMLDIQYYINGVRASFQEVVSDMKRGDEFVKQVNEEKNESY